MEYTSFNNYYKNILSGYDPEREYILAGETYGWIFNLAGGIREMSGDDEYICLCTDNKAVILASLIASLYGGPAVILPHSYSEGTIKEVKDSLGFKLVIADSADRIFRGLEVVTPDLVKGSGGLSRAGAPVRDPDSVFLKLFTGGSTGKSKIWSKTPGNVFGEAYYHSAAMKMNENDIVVATVPPQHIYGLLFSVLAPFISGARVTGEISTYPQEIISAVKDNSASILVSIPIHYRILRGDTLEFPSIRFALSSSGSLDYADGEYFYRQTGRGVTEVFGSTETGGIALKYNTGVESVCMPFTNISWKVTGENLSVRSEFISPELPKDADGYFLTEDRVEKRGDGFINLGRSDGIIKVAGKRVDLKDVENRIKGIPGVSDAVVISVVKPGGRVNEIAALIEGNVDQAYIRRAAKAILETYAVPRKIRIVGRIPVSAAGKYDREKIEQLIRD